MLGTRIIAQSSSLSGILWGRSASRTASASVLVAAAQQQTPVPRYMFAGSPSLSSRSSSTSSSPSGCAPPFSPDWRATHLQAPQAGVHIPARLTVRQRRVIYRCKQRGWLELDILMGQWAIRHVPLMRDGDRQLVEIECLLDAETPDVLNWVLGHADPPEVLQSQTLDSLRAFAAGDGHVLSR